MMFILIGMALFTGIAALSESPQAVQDPQIEQVLTEARQVSTELAEKVRSLLFREIEKGGFVSAVGVCSEMAQQITLQFNARTGYTVRRVSLKYRNPKNIPDEYEREKLKEFNFLNQEKQLSNDYVEVVDEQGQKYLRYMRPLITLPVCITCHGPKENIPSEVKLILAEKYPDDHATEFLVGDVRGAITVKILLSPRR
jgi:hypothetical protein